MVARIVGERMRVVRLFTCPLCGHRLRLGSSRCGDCFSPTPFCNQSRIEYLLIVIAIILLGLAAVLAAA